MYRKKYHWIREGPFRVTLQNMAHFAFSMQNCIHYFRWAAVVTVGTKSFLKSIISDKYGSFHDRILAMSLTVANAVNEVFRVTASGENTVT